ncbi:MAG: hypothetical protein NTX52_15470 [Planctomycetota bacterium]|nr:hypothetical protein [Planctomycetota bacterium]
MNKVTGFSRPTFAGSRSPYPNVAAPKESPQQPVKKAVAEYKYVASKNSQVFHTPNCRSAKRISPENMVGYSSREEAVNAGKNPCKICKP